MDKGTQETMPTPCEQEKSITEIRGLVGEVQRSQLITNENLARMTDKLEDIFNELRGILVEDREHRTRIEHIEKANDILFGRMRKLEDETIPSLFKITTRLEQWQSRVDGQFSTLRVVPVACTIITVLITFFGILYKAAESGGLPVGLP
jgi:uncharacterized coiled-coil protein SlyX